MELFFFKRRSKTDFESVYFFTSTVHAGIYMHSRDRTQGTMQAHLSLHMVNVLVSMCERVRLYS